MMERINKQGIIQLSKVVFGWQLVTLFLSGTIIFSKLLYKYDTNLPSIQSFPAYLLLAIVCWPWYIKKFSVKKPTNSIWKYALISLLDVEGNFCLVMAFRYTTITSITLLNCSTPIFVAILSWRFLGFKMHWFHIFFIALTLLGVGLLFLTDLYFEQSSLTGGNSWRYVLLGNSLVVLGCFFYSVENVSEESMIRNKTPFVEYLSYFGSFAFAICFVQGVAVEFKALQEVFANGRSALVVFFFLGFNICLFLHYFLVPLMLRISTAIAMNLSFLMMSFWAMIAHPYLEKTPIHWMRYISLVVTLLGVFGFQVCCSELFSNKH